MLKSTKILSLKELGRYLQGVNVERRCALELLKGDAVGSRSLTLRETANFLTLQEVLECKESLEEALEAYFSF